MRKMSCWVLAAAVGLACNGGDEATSTTASTDSNTGTSDASVGSDAATSGAQTGGSTGGTGGSSTGGDPSGDPSGPSSTGDATVGTTDGGSTGDGTSTGDETTGMIDPTMETGESTDGSTGGSSGGSSGGCEELPWYPDNDNDGYGAGEPEYACEQPAGYVDQDGDCNDDNEFANPGVDEKCDGMDNDCDSYVDEGSPMNGFCDGCDFAIWDQEPDTVYARCSSGSWFAARGHCQSLGGDLATLKSGAENAFAHAMLNNESAWMGLEDQAVEGDFNWVDGTDLGWSNWDTFQPDNAILGNEDCAEMRTNSKWNDLPCQNVIDFFCEHPL